MALVCDQTVKSSDDIVEEKAAPNDDLEDGEIEDDDEEEVPQPEQQPPPLPPPPQLLLQPQPQQQPPPLSLPPPALVDPTVNKTPLDRDRRDRDRRRHDDPKKTKHMTEAEKSILHLRKRERMQREKWDKYRKDTGLESPVVDDFASNIEKAIANVLKKEKQSSDDDKNDDNRGRKRKNRDRDRDKDKERAKKPRISPTKSDDIDENELLNVRGGSPDREKNDDKKDKDKDTRDRSATPHSESDSGTSSDRSKSEDRRRDHRKNNRKNRDKKQRRDRSRDRRNNEEKKVETAANNNTTKDSKMICVFFLQGKCQKNDCPYSHEAIPPMKLELCKFYLMECCAKGQNCSYMHSEFPCKFYHTGLQCKEGDDCKFAHGKPLSEGLKQILFKHIETAPREILGAGFPRLSREEALNMINVTQQQLIEKYGEVQEEKEAINLYDITCQAPPELSGMVNDEARKDKPTRSRPSRWQDPEPDNKISELALNFGIKPFYAADQDMRITSNGDIDMRTLPPNLTSIPQILAQQQLQSDKIEKMDVEPIKQDIDIRNANILPFQQDVDIRQALDPRLLASKDVDIRQIPSFNTINNSETNSINKDDEQNKPKTNENLNNDSIANLPKMQQDLYRRIQAQQRDNKPEEQDDGNFEVSEAINWYSDDDDEDDNRLTIKEEDKEVKSEDENNRKNIMSPPQVKPLDVVEKLGDLSKIDISAEVTKLLTSMSQGKINRDPRQLTQQSEENPTTVPSSSATVRVDPRKTRTNSLETPKSPTKISIYEQGSIDRSSSGMDKGEDVDSRGRPDVDLRSLQLPFKGMLNYTPAKEIDASINSHPPIVWKVALVDIPRPDYTGLKLNIQDAEKTGDPRLRKIFRLSVDEKDSPASPITSPKASTTTRIDPRLKKQEDKPTLENPSLNFNQQVNILQNSAFFQSLTSNQKLLLNQELASRNDQGGGHDPVLNSLLTNLNLIPPHQPQQNINQNMGTALNILASINKLNPMLNQGAPGQLLQGPQNPTLMNQMAQSMVQPGLLGAAPGIPNLPPDFPINFDPRNGGLLGNAPPPFGPYQQQQQQQQQQQPPQDNFNSFNDDYYQGGNDGGFHHNRENRGFNRDRRRGRNNFNRNSGNRNFRNHRNNRSNRSHTPP